MRMVTADVSKTGTKIITNPIVSRMTTPTTAVRPSILQPKSVVATPNIIKPQTQLIKTLMPPVKRVSGQMPIQPSKTPRIIRPQTVVLFNNDGQPATVTVDARTVEKNQPIAVRPVI